MNSTAAKPTGKPAKQVRRREILEVAFQEFSEKGYNGASMAAIARRAHASKETLYAWFQDKETLFNTVFAARLEGMVSRVGKVAEVDASPASILPVIAEDVIRLLVAITPILQAIGPGQVGKGALKMMGNTIGAERQNFVDYICWCRDEGYIDFDDDPFELTSIFVAMAQGEWSMRLATGRVETITDEMIETHAQRVTRLFLKALAP